MGLEEPKIRQGQAGDVREGKPEEQTGEDNGQSERKD